MLKSSWSRKYLRYLLSILGKATKGAAQIPSVFATPLKKWQSKMQAFLLAIFLVEPQIRLELMTCRLQGGCSTN